MKPQKPGLQLVLPGTVDVDLPSQTPSEHSALLPKPLLAHSSVREITQRRAEGGEDGADSEDEAAISRRPCRHHLQHRALMIFCAFVLLTDMSTHLQDRPQFALVQLAICRDHYRRYDPAVVGPPPAALVHEKLCRADEVQVAIADLRAQWTVVERLVRMLHFLGRLFLLPELLCDLV